MLRKNHNKTQYIVELGNVKNDVILIPTMKPIND